jgi:peptidyl-tRNA hydrolase, PTH1 family
MIIVGLGNPKNQYQGTRHNVGEAILSSLNIEGWDFDKRLNAEVVSMTLGGDNVKLVLPQTFMNLSGQTVGKLIAYPSDANKLVVVHDDLALPIGTFKISFDRGSGGHNGIESVTSAIKTKAFTRVRVGIAPTSPASAEAPAGESTFLGKIKKLFRVQKGKNFVLGKFTPNEREVLENIKPKIMEAILTIITDGHEVAMNKYN